METGSPAMLAESIGAAAAGIAILDEQDSVVYANAAFATQLRLADSSSLIGTSPLFSWTHGASEQERHSLEGQLRDPDASVLSLQIARNITTTLYLDDRREGRRIVMVINDWPRPDAPRNVVAQIDALTGLANRATYDKHVQKLSDVEEESLASAVILLDLDRFKQVNDTLGHAAGDTLLILAAKRMRSAIRGDDILIRRNYSAHAA